METPRDVVELRIPRKPEFVSVARLAVSGIAGRLDFSYDEVEDIKLAVGEACTSAIQETSPESVEFPIVVRCESDPEAMVIEVVDSRRPGARSAVREKGEDKPISRLLMEVLMDEVDVSEGPDDTVSVRMTKYVSRDQA